MKKTEKENEGGGERKSEKDQVCLKLYFFIAGTTIFFYFCAMN